MYVRVPNKNIKTGKTILGCEASQSRIRWALIGRSYVVINRVSGAVLVTEDGI